MSTFVDYYALLQVSPQASTEEIERAFRNLARKYHPDINPDPEAKEMFQKLVEAREVLTDPKRRLLYDREWRRHHGVTEEVEPTPAPEPEQTTVPTVVEAPAEPEPQTAPFQRHFWDVQVLYSRSALIADVAPQRLYALTRWRPPLPNGRLNPDPHPFYLLWVVDVSRSMHGPNLALLSQLVQHLADFWQPTDIHGLITFADRAELQVFPAPNQAEAVLQALLGVKGRGATEFLPPLQMVLELSQRIPQGYFPWVLFVTDGRAYDQPKVREALFPRLRETNVVIDVLGLGHEWDERFLEALTATTGGALYYVRGLSEALEVLSRRVQRLRRAYVWNALLEWEETGASVVRALVRRAPEVAWYTPEAGAARLGPLAPGEFWEVLWEWEWMAPAPAGQDAPLVQGRVQAVDARGTRQQYDFVLARPVVRRESAPVFSPAPELVQAVQRLTWHRLQAKMREAAHQGRVREARRYLRYLRQRAKESGEQDLARALEAQARRLERERRFTQAGEKDLFDRTRRLMLPALYRNTSSNRP